MNDNKFYVYQLVDPRNNQPFYIGKGTGYRMKSHLTEAKQPKIKWTNAIKCERIVSIWTSGLDVIAAKIATDLSESDAFILEDKLIQQYGLLITNTGILTNVHSSSSFPRSGNIKRHTKSVIQYDMDGSFVTQFNSASSAAAAINIRIDGILKCCKGRRNYAGGFRWTFVGDPLMPMKECEYHTSRRKSVFQYTTDGTLLSTFQSVKQASVDTGIDASNIIACCKGYMHANTAGGFKWSYDNDII